MINEAILGLVVIALLIERYFSGVAHAKQQKDLLRLIKAKSLEEVTQAELIDKVEPAKSETIDPEFIPAEQMDDALFNKMIKEQNGQSN